MRNKPLPGMMRKSPLKNKPSFDIKGYFKGEQGLIPDYKGESTKETFKSIFETKQYPGGYSKQKKYQERGQSKSASSRRKTK